MADRAHVVFIEYRDLLGRIVEEIDTVWHDIDKASARAKVINTDLHNWPHQVAGVVSIQVSDAAPHPKRVADRIGLRASPENPDAKLTDDDIRAVRQMSSAGERHGDIARTLGIPSTTVTTIVRGKRWARVE